MSPPLRLGVIGCGRVVERFYLPALGRLAHARVTAVADPLPERRSIIAAHLPGARAFAAPEELLEGGEIDALLIASPASTHAELTEQAVRRHIPVLVEKPLATSPAEADRLLRLGAGSKLLVMVGFNRRYMEPLPTLREELREHGVEPSHARLVLAAPRKGWNPVEERHDVLTDLGPHQLDLVPWLLGTGPSAVCARWTSPTTVEMRLELLDGSLAEGVVSHEGEYRETVTVERGTDRWFARAGSVRLRPAAGPTRALRDGFDAVVRRLRRGAFTLHASYGRQLEAFLECVRSGEDPQPGIADGVAAVRAVDAARRSAESGGTPVSLDVDE